METDVSVCTVLGNDDWFVEFLIPRSDVIDQLIRNQIKLASVRVPAVITVDTNHVEILHCQVVEPFIISDDSYRSVNI